MLKSLFFALPLLSVATCGPSDNPPGNPSDAKLEKIRELPSEIRENSGMTAYNDLLWIINDSGHDAGIFGYNIQSGNIDKKIIVAGVENIDWEEISQDAQHIYIGDFGNNASGNRTDLQILIINKSDFSSARDSVDLAGSIHFVYEDQTDFSARAANTAGYDCEAFVVLTDSIVLFTKDWQRQITKIYTLPLSPGDHVARLRKEFNVLGLVTASAFSAEKNELMLMGYDANLFPFLWVVPGFSEENLTFNNSRQSEFKGFQGYQTEGIAIFPDGSLYAGSEEFIFQQIKFPSTFFRVIL